MEGIYFQGTLMDAEHVKRWFKQGLLHIMPQKSECENGPLITVQNYLLERIKHGTTADCRKRLYNTLISLRKEDGNFDPLPCQPSTHWSHDNDTPVKGISYLEGFDIHQDILPDWKERPHPRDLIFYAYLRKAWWSYPLIWVVLVAQIFSCLKTYKIRPTLYKRIKLRLQKGKWPHTRKMLHTDGKLLTWVRCQCTMHDSFTMRLSWKITNWILKNKYKKEKIDEKLWKPEYEGLHHWSVIFAIYFKHPEHPNRVSARQIYG